MSSMPSPMPCCDPCPSTVSTPLPGAQGNPGTNGTNGTDGTNGLNSYTTLAGAFTMPAEGASASAFVVSSLFAVVGQNLFLQGEGWMQVVSTPDSTHVVLLNLRNTGSSLYLQNSVPGTIVGIGSALGPGGLQGPPGANGSLTGAAGGDLVGSTYPNPVIAPLKVTTGKIADFAVTSGKISIGAVGTSQLANNAVGTAELQDDAVGTAQIALLAVTDAQVAAGNKDGAAGTPCMRTLGTGSTQAAAGNDSRFTATPVTQFASANQTVPVADAATVIVAHGLAGLPQLVRWVLVCTSGELNYSVGNEVLLQSAGCTAASDITTRVPEIADVTNCQLGAYLWNTNPLRLADKVSGTNTPITPSNWKLKVYAGHY